MRDGGRPVRLNAYVLAGDPAWIPHSVGAYYDLVSTIVVSYDRRHLSWSGASLSVGAALDRLRAVDTEGKMRFLPGDHSDTATKVLTNETNQRQRALDAASDDADWVIQLDTDEILLNRATFLSAVGEADQVGADAIEYPLRDFYQRVGPNVFLEHCGRFWTDRAGYPGPVAVRAGTHLSHCRQTDQRLFRVDFRSRNTDPWHPGDAPVHRVVPRSHGIAHMSWVRTMEQMLEKSRTSGYASSRDWSREIPRWEFRRRHPWLTVAAAPFWRREEDRLRLARLDLPV